MIVSLLMLLAALGYGAAAAGFQWNLLRRQKQDWALWTRLVWLSFGLHTIALIALWCRLGAPPVFRLRELTASVSWLVIGLYTLLGRGGKMAAVGTVAAPCACVCVAFSAFTLHGDEAVDRASSSWWLAIHIGSLMASYATFCLAASCAMIYFLQARYLKRKRLRGALLLPSLEALDRAAYRLILAGFPLLLLGIVSGTQLPTWKWSWDIKQTLLVATCIFDLLYLHARAIAGWRGKRVNAMLLTAFALMMLAVLAPSSVHQH